MPQAAPRPADPRLSVLPGGAAVDQRMAAVIDLGSNSWRLVIYAYMPGASWRRVGQLQEPVRVAEGLSRTGALTTEAIARGLETLEMFARYLHARGIAPGAVDAVATSAIRDAANGADLLELARERTRLSIDVLPPEEEARLGYVAAVNSTTLTDGVVLDLGGGSLQLTRVAGRYAHESGSWPLGAVRMSEQLLPGQRAPSRKQLKQARTALRAQLADTAWLAGAGRRLVGMGGAVRNLAAAAQGGGEGIQGVLLERGALSELVAELARRPASRRALPGIKATRADIVLAAAMVLETVVELGGFDGIEVTRAGLREGVFFQRRLLRESAPLLGDVRAASIRNLALHFDADLGHADHVARLALQLHDSLVAERVIQPAPEERELLWAAALLHDIGMTIGYDSHPDHAHYLIMQSGLPGYGPREVELIAQIVRHHRKGAPAEARVARCALLLQLAEQLDRGEDQSVIEARLIKHRRTLQLRLRGDAQLALWSLERRLSEGAFRRAFGLRLDVAG